MMANIMKMFAAPQNEEPVATGFQEKKPQQGTTPQENVDKIL
jgi:hypothetical protein